ncbi:hypothetical protein KSF78_0005133 [Schistosoma japonicum]|nr:hypothetical protein KSF78_0005133 [Schistosoma japonicum]
MFGAYPPKSLGYCMKIALHDSLHSLNQNIHFATKLSRTSYENLIEMVSHINQLCFTTFGEKCSFVKFALKKQSENLFWKMSTKVFCKINFCGYMTTFSTSSHWSTPNPRCRIMQVKCLMTLVASVWIENLILFYPVCMNSADHALTNGESPQLQSLYYFVPNRLISSPLIRTPDFTYTSLHDVKF